MADTTLTRTLPEEALLAALARAQGEGDTAARRAALVALQATAPPERSAHLWRFTDPALLLPGTWDAATAPAATAAEPSADPAAYAGSVTLLPGQAPRVDMGEAAVAAGVTVTPLAAASAPARETAAAADDGGFFPLLNAAAWNCGVLVTVPAGVVLEKPLRVAVPAASLALPRLLVVVEREAAVTLLEDHHGEAGRVLGVTLLAVGAGARVRHLLVQRWGDTVTGYLHRAARLERDARLLTAFAALGGGRAKQEIAATLAGTGARSEMIGVSLADGDGRRLDQHTRHRHTAARTTSDIDFRAVVAGSARSSYTGLIRIAEEARGSEAFQENRNLLLSDRARADSIPELEILNEDVSCSHGATVAPVDPAQLFYLSSRGLTPGEATRLVVGGFLGPTLSRLPAPLRARLDDLVARRTAAWPEAAS